VTVLPAGGSIGQPVDRAPFGDATPQVPSSGTEQASRFSLGIHAPQASERALQPAANLRGAGVYPGEQTQLWVQGKDDPRSIDWRAVIQGTAGTCAAGAVMTSLSHSDRGRNVLARNITDNGDCTLNVRLLERDWTITLDRIKTMPMGYGDHNGQRSDPRREI
jgi:hypothetical protein